MRSIICAAAVVLLATPAITQDLKLTSGWHDVQTATVTTTEVEGGRAVLWDQSSAIDPNALVDQVFTDLPQYSSFIVCDVSTGGAPWNVTQVTTYFTKGFGAWSPAAITQGNLQVYPKTGPLPDAGELPPEYTVPLNLVDNGTFWTAVADTSGVAELQGINGDFWIGLTPITSFAAGGQEFHQMTTITVGDISAWRNPGNGFGFGTAWQPLSVIGSPSEGAITLEGELAGPIVLWDQSAIDGTNAFVDQVFTDLGQYSSFIVNDVSTGCAAWNVTQVTTYFTKGIGAWSPATVTTANLQVYPKTGALPAAGELPPEYTVPINLVDLGTNWAAVADTSGIAELQGISGDFWIGLTPITAFGVNGQEFHETTVPTVGDVSAWRNPGGGFGLGTAWNPLSLLGTPPEATILLEGFVTDTWVDLGGGLASPAWGVIPAATGSGLACPDTRVEVDVVNSGPAFGFTNLVVGGSAIDAPFKGGILVPAPDYLFLGIPTGAQGNVSLGARWPFGIPAGMQFWFQFWASEGGGLWSASNALRVTAL